MFNENEAVVFEAEVYNESFEAITEPDVYFEIYNADEKKFSYTFNRSDDSYFINTGVFPVGDYRYLAQVTIGAEIF